ncbi:hypothetical protein DIE03_35005 [Burkholderia sp. Bp8992]|uniref:hypothetical protein n=1 Tax=Burkholderia sp. Bp8992 TaxID=2184554 RepID=UPI000F57E2CB|nr:hypothetical protein [Burkholderia sp. Bp8992]RQS19155.1 hypothetical protein DIE03_35005 [Burkholderia sp. Bp8992]
MNSTTPSSAPIRPPMGRPATVLLAFSMLFYLVAMFTAPFRVGAPDPHPWADGWQVLLTGWMGVFVAVQRTCGCNARNQYDTATAPPSGVPIARSPR